MQNRTPVLVSLTLAIGAAIAALTCSFFFLLHRANYPYFIYWTQMFGALSLIGAGINMRLRRHYGFGLAILGIGIGLMLFALTSLGRGLSVSL